MVIRKHFCLSQALQSLNQLHKLAPADRKQYYMLSNVEHTLGDDHSAKGLKSPVSVHNAHQVLQEHPMHVFRYQTTQLRNTGY